MTVGPLTASTIFPVVLAGLLVSSSLFVAVRSGVSQQSESRAVVPAVGLVIGSAGVVGSVGVVLSRPQSIFAFVVGALGATLCYVAVLAADCGTDSSRLAGQVVRLCALLWIAGALTVGRIAASDTTHYLWGGGIGIVLTGILFIHAFQHRGADDGARSQIFAGGLLPGSFILPVSVGVVFGEEILFVVYLITAVLSCILWWFHRLATERV